MRSWKHWLLVALACVVTTAHAAPEGVAGKQYLMIEPSVQVDAAPGKVAVLEFFSYACPHCASFNPLVAPWAKELPATHQFQHVPVTFGRADWANLARLYYSLDVLGLREKLHEAVFHALHEGKIELGDEKTQFDWIASQGVDRAKYEQAFRSFGVSAKVKRGDQLASAHHIRGVPAMAVGGVYLVNNAGLKSYEELLSVTRALADKALKTKP